MTDFGTDIYGATGIDPTGRNVTGTLLLSQAIARRVTTRRGWVLGAPDYGIDVGDYIGQDITDSDLPRINAEVTAEIEKDDRVFTVTVTTSLSSSGTTGAPKTMKMGIDGTSAPGPFRLVLAVSDVTTTILEAS